MARRSGFERALIAASRDISRQVRIAEQARKRMLREQATAARQANAQAARDFRLRNLSAKEAERERKAAYLEAREEQVRQLNADLERKLDEYATLLQHTLHVNDAIEFDTLRITDKFVPPKIPPELLTKIEPPDFKTYFSHLKAPGKLASALMPWVKRRFERAVAEATERAKADLQKIKASEADRQGQLQTLRDRLAKQQEDFSTKVAMRDAEVDAFQNDYMAGEPDALVAYFSMVLERSEYPDEFPQNFSIAYQSASRQLVIEYELPAPSIVPMTESYRYVRTRDVIDEKPRKSGDLRAIYSDLVAGVVLRTLHETFESDTKAHVETVCINAFVQAIDPATGRDIRPYLVSVRTTRDRFLEIDLGRVDKGVCLKNLGAQVSRNPEEVQAVKPIVDFKMADARFVDQSDLVSALSDAVNLMDLNPYEFEHLVANLFGKMGLESKLTRSSRDGGVDCVAFDPRPVLGGKVVIQAKRYRHTVGVSAVRDLYGTMMNEGASKGLLVTTSGYGPDAFNFAKDKPIELIDGGGLLYLLHDIGVSARIVMPEE